MEAVQASVAAEVALESESEEVQVKETQVVILSANLRNFDRFCASQPADLSAKLLHQYLFLMSREVGQLGGQLQHIQGSELLAVWREGLDQAALEQISILPKKLWQCTQDWLQIWSLQQTQELRDQRHAHSDDLVPTESGLVPTSFISDSIRLGRELQLEMGLELGEVMLGSMGPSDRRVHAVIGEPVQVAHSLRAMSSELSYPALLGPRLFGVLDDAHVKPLVGQDRPLKLGEFLLSGLTESRLIYAFTVNLEPSRLYLVDTANTGDWDQRVA
jgi:adenylate cyclase